MTVFPVTMAHVSRLQFPIASMSHPPFTVSATSAGTCRPLGLNLVNKLRRVKGL
jgi:hypothetical protein